VARTLHDFDMFNNAGRPTCRRARRFNQRANSGKANPNKTKQNGFHLLSFVFFYFSESGLSKRVTAEKNKNFPLFRDSRGRL
jgi:hypothetical protein